MDKKSLTTDWIYYSPSFEFIKELPLGTSAWSGHYFFAYDLVRNVKPKVIVELGTHKGNSLFSMAQAIKDGKLETELHGIDTWEGDPQAGYYGEDVYNQFLNISKKYYKDVKILPYKMLFDNAVKEFKDNSIDILHIDGLHTYKAVKHDFETWLPKVKKDTGIIMLHDVCETKDDFGVYKLWGELKKKYKNTITFEHYHGLGVIFIKNSFEIINNNFPSYYTVLSKNQDLFCSLEESRKKNRELEKELKDIHINFERSISKEKVWENKEKVWENKEKVWENKEKVWENKEKVWENKEKVWENKEKVWENKEKVWKKYEEELTEFSSFKKGKIWKTLEKYRDFKKTIQGN